MKRSPCVFCTEVGVFRWLRTFFGVDFDGVPLRIETGRQLPEACFFDDNERFIFPLRLTAGTRGSWVNFFRKPHRYALPLVTGC